MMRQRKGIDRSVAAAGKKKAGQRLEGQQGKLGSSGCSERRAGAVGEQRRNAWVAATAGEREESGECSRIRRVQSKTAAMEEVRFQ
ncbi:hypothetical protein LXL04_014406 [Taraxacum kok-saghyz]